MRRDLYGPDHEAFREVVKAYVKREVIPNQQRWEQERNVGRPAWLAAGKQSIIGLLIPERFGGADWTAAERWDEMARVMRPVFTSQDAQEGARAFAEKRAPVWKGR